MQYYPSALQAGGAQVLELGPGQEIKGIDFTVRRLAERTVRVSVKRADGNAAADARICVVYERTKEYDSLQNANSVKDTDQNGLAMIHVYGKSRVRVFAEESVENGKESRQDTRYSRRVESEASKMPDEIDLVLNAAKP